MDKSQGTEIGDTAPFTESPEGVNEDTAVHNSEEQNCPSPGTGKIGNTSPYDKKVNEDTVDVDDVAGMPAADDDELPFPEVEDGGAYLDFEKTTMIGKTTVVTHSMKLNLTISMILH